MLVLQGWAAYPYLEFTAPGHWQQRLGRNEDLDNEDLEMAKFNPFKFLQEVRQETNKVTWPSRKETGITTAMVFVFAAAAAIFFLLADQVIRMVVTLVLGIGT